MKLKEGAKSVLDFQSHNTVLYGTAYPPGRKLVKL
jgi:hypothetical protein